jgi:hypothetical protein
MAAAYAGIWQATMRCGRARIPITNFSPLARMRLTEPGARRDNPSVDAR